MEYCDMAKEYEIFSDCFPDIYMSEKVFEKKLSGGTVFRECENGILTAFAVTDKNSVAVICVSPEYQNKGLGRKLLKKCEEAIFDSGYDKAVLGRTEGDLFWGAVINNMSHHFFEKCGYCAYNGCLDMTLCIEDLSYEEMKRKYPCPDEVSFEIISEDELPELADAVNEVEPKWAVQYTPGRHEKFMAARSNGRIAGFITLDTDADTIITDGENKVGLPGYLGVVPSERKKGIGRNIMLSMMQYFKEQGCTDIFINYTSLDEWYADIGFEEYLWFWMGEKNLR